MNRTACAIAASLTLLVLLLTAGAVAAEPPASVAARSADPLASVRIDPQSLRGSEGFFRVGRSTTGRWWLVDPDGRPFLYRGVCAINRAGSMGGRRAVPGAYADVVDRKYDYQADPERFVQATFDRLRQWGFNATGAWTTDEFFDKGMPYTEIIEFNYTGHSIRAAGVDVPDVFDPAWVQAADELARQLCAPRRNSRMLVGYFTDNELSWGQPGTDHVWGQSAPRRRPQPTLLQVCLTLPADRAAHQAAWQFVLARHGGSYQQVGQAWGIELTGRDGLRRLTREATVLSSAAYGRDHDAFSRAFAQRYVRVTAEAIRRHDPNHLILGARFGAPPTAPILDAFRFPHVDVLSANNYRTNMYGRMDIYYRAHQMPILIGEYAWHSGYYTDRRAEGLSGEAAAIASIERMGPRTLEEAFKHPGVVGYTWYRWVHNANGARSYGLVHRADDEVNELNIRLLQQVHPRLERIAAQDWPYPLYEDDAELR